MTDHQQALERVHDRIIEQFGDTNDPVELEKLEGIADIGMRVAAFLQSEIADVGTWVDTGSNGETYDCTVIVCDREYDIEIKAGPTDAEVEQWKQGLETEASQWDLLCPRVIEVLRRADPDLAGEFETYVAPR